MRNRTYYNKLYKSYPDVVTLPQFREMLGGIGDSTARKLMRENRVKHFYIQTTYLIPKTCVIDCGENRMDGVVRLSRVWLIPKDAKKPADGRLKELRVR